MLEARGQIPLKQRDKVCKNSIKVTRASPDLKERIKAVNQEYRKSVHQDGADKATLLTTVCDISCFWRDLYVTRQRVAEQNVFGFSHGVVNTE